MLSISLVCNERGFHSRPEQEHVIYIIYIMSQKKKSATFIFGITLPKVEQLSSFSLLNSERICGGSLN